MDTVRLTGSDLVPLTTKSDLSFDTLVWEYPIPERHATASSLTKIQVTSPKYLVVIVDEFTRYMWVYPTETKESFHLGVVMHHWWSTYRPLIQEQRARADSNVQDWRIENLAIHADAGTEFAGMFKRMALAREVQIIAAPSHQQWKNGPVEGRIKLLKQLVQISSIQFGAPNRATYVCQAHYAAGMLNMLPTAQLTKRGLSTPWEALYGRPPNKNWMLPYGATLYVRDYRPNSLGSGRKAYFVGVATGPTFGFKVRYENSQRIHEVQHATIMNPSMTSMENVPCVAWCGTDWKFNVYRTTGSK